MKNRLTLYLWLITAFFFVVAASFFVVCEIKAQKQLQEKDALIAELQQKNKTLEDKTIEISNFYNDLEIKYDELENEQETLVQENEELKSLITEEVIEEITTEEELEREEPTTAIKKEEVTTECVITTTTAPIEEVTEEIIDEEPATKEELPTADTTLSKELTGDEYFEGVKLQYSAPYDITDNKLTATKGVVRFNGHKECYYTQTLLPGKGLYLPGRHVAEDGTIRDGDGYICVAANLKFLPRYTKVMTTLGPGIVYDTGCAYGTVDIYTDW